MACRKLGTAPEHCDVVLTGGSRCSGTETNVCVVSPMVRLHSARSRAEREGPLITPNDPLQKASSPASVGLCPVKEYWFPREERVHQEHKSCPELEVETAIGLLCHWTNAQGKRSSHGWGEWSLLRRGNWVSDAQWAEKSLSGTERIFSVPLSVAWPVANGKRCTQEREDC